MTTYYVDGTLGTNGTGTTLNPFNNLQAGADELSGGDTLIVRPATYRNQEVQFEAAANGTSGTPTNVTFEAGCIIDGQFTKPSGPPWGSESGKAGSGNYAQGYLVTFRYCKHFVVEGNGLEIKNSQGSGLLITGDPDNALLRGLNISVSNVKIHDVRWQFAKADESDEILFDYLECYNGGLFAPFSRAADACNWPNGMTMKDGSGMVITNSSVYKHWGEGISLTGGGNSAGTGEIGWCVIHNNFSAHLYANRNKNVIIHDNFVYHCGLHTGQFLRGASIPQGLRFNNEHARKQAHRPPNENIKCYNNVIVGMGNNLSFGDQGDLGHTDIWVYNNTFVNSVEIGGGKRGTGIELNSGVYNNVNIKNNIIYQYVNDDRVDEILGSSNAVAAECTFGKNIWFDNSSSNQPDVNFRGSGDYYGDPLLVNPAIPSVIGSGNRANYALQSGSPAINLGGATIDATNSITAPTTDIAGATRSGNPDAGAYEYGVSGPYITAGFSFTPASGTAPLSVAFTDSSTSSASITTRTWSYRRDGGAWTQFSTSTNPTRSFTDTGSYDIRLVAVSSVGSDTEDKLSIISVSPEDVGEPPVGTSLIINGEFGSALNNWIIAGDVTNSANKALMIGAAGTSTRLFQKNISVTAGTAYTLTFDAYGASGGEVLLVDLRQHLSPNNVLGIDTSFTLTNTSARYTVNFEATETYANGRLRFQFNTAQTVYIDNVYLSDAVATMAADFTITPTTGTYPITMAYNATITSTNLPVTNLRYLRATGGSTWFLTGSGTSNSSPITITGSFEPANATGSYDFKLVATDLFSSVTVEKLAYVTVTEAITNYITADFGVTPATGASPLTVTLLDGSSSSASITAWLWEYKLSSDVSWTTHSTSGTPATLVLSSTGFYDFQLTVTSSAGSDTKTLYEAVYVRGDTALNFTLVGTDNVPYTLNASAALTSGDWHFVVARYDGSTMTLFLDGVELDSVTDVELNLDFADSSFYVGQRAGTQHVNGMIDDLFVTDTAIDTDLVRAIYESDAPVFAETNPGGIRSGSNRVEITDEGIYVIDQESDPVLGLYCGDNPDGKAWGGLFLGTGDLLIGSATDNNYAWWDASAKTLKLRGDILVEGPVPWDNITGAPNTLEDLDPAAANRLAGVESNFPMDWSDVVGFDGVPLWATDDRVGVAINATGYYQRIFRGVDVIGTQTPGTGLNLTSTYMGYYDGSAFKTFIKSDGKLFFAGESGATIGWDGVDLFGTNGTTVQWYARAATGKLYAGGGSVIQDENGVTILAQTVSTAADYVSPKSIDFERSSGELAARLTGYYLTSGTEYGLHIMSNAPDDEPSQVTIGARQAGLTYGGTNVGESRIIVRGNDGGGGYIDMRADGYLSIYTDESTAFAAKFDGSNNALFAGATASGSNNLIVGTATSNIGLNGASFGGGVGMVFIGNAHTAPSSNPTAGYLLYAQSGSLRGRGSSGTTKTLGNAEPHCPVCGRDAVLEWENEREGWHIQLCTFCLADELGDRPWIHKVKSGHRIN